MKTKRGYLTIPNPFKTILQISLGAFFIAFVLLSCNSSTDPELDKLRSENDSLRKLNVEKEEGINEMLQAFNDIEDNLALIKEKEGVIENAKAYEGELSNDAKTRIENDIQTINELMEENKRTIARLKRQIQDSQIKMSEFEKMIDNLMAEIEAKDMEIATLKEELVNMNFALENLNKMVDTLTQENVSKTETIEQQTEELNTGYYAIGTERELKDNKVISKEGGFIGLGSTNILKGNFNKTYFTRVDIRDKTSIRINKKKVEIITTHPSDAYRLKKRDDVTESIEIIDPQKFWSASKYLVIVVK